jgi:hypothetical protein
MIKQILSTRVNYQNYKTYATATMDKILPLDKRKDAVQLSANQMASAFIRNDGNGKFSINPLPVPAQLSILNGMVADDFDNDGNIDIAFNTNDYGTDPAVGRYDALNGLILKGNGKGDFIPLTILESGLYINGNGKGLCKLKSANGSYLLVSTQNRGPIHIFKRKRTGSLIQALPYDAYAMLVFADGKKQRAEFNYGASFLSQSSRFLLLPANVTSCTITDTNGKTRNEKL